MKRLPYLFLGILFLVACEKESINTDLPSEVEHSQKTITRSYEEALSIANSSLSFFPSTRGVVNRTIDEQNSLVIKNDKKTRSSASISDTLFYVFNFTGNNGFAVVSALNSSEDGLIAVTEEGDFESSIEENPGFAFIMERAKEYVSRGVIVPALEPIDTTIIQSRGPKILVAWGQRYPEGSLYHNGLAGCSNTAIAQILTYYMYPSTIVYSENGTNENVNLSWSEINKHKRTLNNTCYACIADSDAHVAISKLVRQIGLWNLSNDTTSITGTSTVISNQLLSISALGYNYTSLDYYSTGIAASQINNNKLLLMFGRTNDNQGHAWVVDGYKTLRILYLDHLLVEPALLTVTKTYNHVNWGWNGIANGYFQDGIFDITNELEYDYSLSFTNSFNFNNTVGYTAIDH